MGLTRRILIALAVFGLLVVSVPHDAESSHVREVEAVTTAERQMKQLMDVVRLFMTENRRVPTWKDLITPDERGHRWIDSDDPLPDPWGNTYVIATNSDSDEEPVVQSAGPDGTQGTADDISCAPH